MISWKRPVEHTDGGHRQTGAGPPVAFRQRLTVRLTTGVILALLLIGVPFLFAFHRLRRQQQIDALTEAAGGLSRIVVDSLRSAMLSGQPHLLDEVIRDLSVQPEVERVLVLDRAGRVRLSSDPSFEDRWFDREVEPLCQACHQEPGILPDSKTILADEGDRQIFRAMSTIPNESRCHGCHDPSAPTNGVLLMDLSLKAADRGFFAGIGNTVALGTPMVILTVAVLVWLLQRMVHEPLGAVVATSRQIVRGDLEARVRVRTADEFGFLATQFNRMTNHLAESLRAVESHRRELQAVLDSVDDEIVVLDRQRRVMAANHAFRVRSANDAEVITGRACREVSCLPSPCAEEAGSCPVEKVFETGKLHKAIFSGRRSDGTERTIEIHASPLTGADEAVTQVVEVRRDISERRQMEATLAHSERLASLGLLASGISHEVNNPLGAIATSVEGLRRKLCRAGNVSLPGGSSVEETLQRIGCEVQRARSITDRLLKVARPPGGTRSLVDVNRALSDTLAMLSYDIKRAGIETRTELASGLPPLCDDESRLGQILMNLILNALQAMNGGGILRVATSCSQGYVQIEVEDTGEGIPPEMVNRIYEPFFTTKPAGKGTGLGLFITHRMVTEVGGTIDVCSRPGEGSVFTVRLPTGTDRAGSHDGQQSTH